MLDVYYRDFVHVLDVSLSETKHLRTCHGCQLELMWIVQGMEELASEHAVRSPCSWLYAGWRQCPEHHAPCFITKVR